MMRKSFAVLALALELSFGTAFAQQDPFGNWQGEIGPGIIDLGIFVTLEGPITEPSGTLDIPVQGLFDFPLGEVVIDSDAVSFIMPGVPGDPVFAGMLAGDRIEGTFTQGSQPIPFYLEHTAWAAGGSVANARPQEPKPPFPYRSEDIRYGSGDVTLTGTLTLPEGEGPFSALLLITGSGPQDRNEELFGHKPFLVLADYLTRAGYAVLRVDDRGMGGSTGLDSDASYTDLLTDVLAGIRFLTAQPEVNAEHIGLLGHSQGGSLAIAAAAASNRIAFVIMLAGPAVSGLQILEFQNARVIEQALRASNPAVTDAEITAATADAIKSLRELYKLMSTDDFEGAGNLVRELVTEQFAALELPPESQPTDTELEQIITAEIAGTVNNSMRSLMVFDPQPLLRHLTVPVLALYGSLDVQVDAVQNEAPLVAALEAARNTDYTVKVLQELNHLLQPAVTGAVAEYALIPTTIDPMVLGLIGSWLQDRFPR